MTASFIPILSSSVHLPLLKLRLWRAAPAFRRGHKSPNSTTDRGFSLPEKVNNSLSVSLWQEKAIVKNIAVLFIVAVFLASCAPVPPTPTPIGVTQTPSPAPAAIKHVFVVVMENKSYAETWNTSSTPYMTSLGNQYARATNFHALTHPSLPNYLDMIGGTNGSVTTDCNPSDSCHVATANLTDNLEAKGLTWKAYMESMPAPCTMTISGKYYPKHNPFLYFDSIRNNADRCTNHDVPYTNLALDLLLPATTPNYAFIAPNICNDIHDCSIATGDTWLKDNLPPILNSPACTVDQCLVILTFDEDDGSQQNQVLTIFAGSGAKTGGAASAAAYTHYSALRTVEEIFGLATLTSNDAAATPMTDMLK